MVLSPKSGLGRLLLFLIIVTTIAYLVLNLSSFGGTPWITTTSFNIYYGLWKVCDFSNTSISDVCNQWSDSPYSSKYLTTIFPNGKPGFIQSAQGLEITSLVLYVLAVALIIIGILNLRMLSFEIFFFAAAILLFLCIVFLSASLGLMSRQGRADTRYDSLSWAWWSGLFGLLMTVICFLSLLGIIFAVNLSSSFKPIPLNHQQQQQQQQQGSNKPQEMLYGPPQIYGQSYDTENYYNYNQYPQNNYSHDYGQNPMVAYGGGHVPNPGNHYDQSQNPAVSQLAIDFVWDPNDPNYQGQVSGPYGQYMHQHHSGYPNNNMYF